MAETENKVEALEKEAVAEASANPQADAPKKNAVAAEPSHIASMNNAEDLGAAVVKPTDSNPDATKKVKQVSGDAQQKSQGAPDAMPKLSGHNTKLESTETKEEGSEEIKEGEMPKAALDALKKHKEKKEDKEDKSEKTEASHEDEKMKKPSDVLGTQVGHAYYYLDNVKVTPIEAKSQCACSAADEVRTDLVFGAAAPAPDASADEVVAGSAVYYAFLKRRPTGAGEMAIKRLADLLKDNPSWKLRVIGHTDTDEFNEGKINPRYRELGYKRAGEVVKKFGEFGIAEDRFIVDSMEADDPASTRDSDISRAKNRRVVFELVK